MQILVLGFLVLEKEYKNIMIINHNMSAINAHRALKFNQWNLDKSMRKLASGERINRSGDDPAGMGISEKMRTQIEGLRQAERNAENGMSFVQTTESYISQMSDIIRRIRVLAIQASNGIYSNDDRQIMQVEVSQLIDEVDRVASQAEFNRFSLLQGEYSRGSNVSSMWFHVGPNIHQRERVYIATMTAQALQLKGNDGNLDLSNQTQANDAIGRVDYALDVLNKERANLGAYQNRLEHISEGLMNVYESMQSAESRIRDVDVAEEVIELTRSQILSHVGLAMLAQASVRTQGVMYLLQ